MFIFLTGQMNSETQSTAHVKVSTGEGEWWDGTLHNVARLRLSEACEAQGLAVSTHHVQAPVNDGCGHIRPRLQQRTHGVGAAAFRRSVQGSVPCGVNMFQLTSRGHQKPYKVCVVALRSTDKGRRAHLNNHDQQHSSEESRDSRTISPTPDTAYIGVRVHSSPCGMERLGDVQVARLGAQQQRSGSRARRRICVAARSKQLHHACKMPICSCHHQRRVPRLRGAHGG